MYDQSRSGAFVLSDGKRSSVSFSIGYWFVLALFWLCFLFIRYISIAAD